VKHNYPHIHSIELSERWYHYNVEQFQYDPHVKIYLGDSKKILPELLSTLNEPVTVYLDAHYSGGTTARGEEEVPLLAELEILKHRPYPDIIIVDDGRLFGTSGNCGKSDNPYYPEMTYNWSDITEDKIIRLMKEEYILLKNDHQMYTDGPSDQYILVKPM